LRPHDARRQRHGARVVGAQDHGAVEGHAVGVHLERILDGGQVGIEIEMLEVDVCDDGDRRGQVHELAVAFVRFGDDVAAAAQARVAGERAHLAAHDHGGIEAALRHYRCDQRRGRGFSVRTADCHRVFETQELGKHFAARNDGNALAPGFDDLGVVGLDGTGIHHDIGARDMAAFVPLPDRRTHFREARRDIGRLHVRAAHVETQVQQHFGDAAHADAADTDEMNALGVSEEDHVQFLVSFRPLAPPVSRRRFLFFLRFRESLPPRSRRRRASTTLAWLSTSPPAAARSR
jgi:hypothetical protein